MALIGPSERRAHLARRTRLFGHGLSRSLIRGCVRAVLRSLSGAWSHRGARAEARGRACRESLGKPTRTPTKANIGPAKSQDCSAQKPSEAKGSQRKPRCFRILAFAMARRADASVPVSRRAGPCLRMLTLVNIAPVGGRRRRAQMAGVDLFAASGGEIPENTGIRAPSKARECPEKPGYAGESRESGLFRHWAPRTTEACASPGAGWPSPRVDGCLRLLTFVDC